MKTKGELTTQQIVGIIILIVSFVVILAFIFRLNLGETTEKEICHNSVALKGQSALASGPLDCKTSYVCITGGEECEGFSESRTIEVDLDKDEILKTIADEMADCWWMFGEGKIDYTKGIDWGDVTGNKACALCSIISFDIKIKDSESIEFTIGDFYEYLRINEKEKGKSYLYYLTGKSDYNKENSIYDKPLDLTKKYNVLTGISEEGSLKSIGNFFLGSIDDFNDIFFSFIDVPSVKGKERYGHIPVSLVSRDDLGKLECGEFLTKA